MEVFLAQVFNGLSVGSIYVLLVTCFNLLLLVSRIIHFSFPVVVVFSMYISWYVINGTENIFLGIILGIISAIILNVLSSPIFQHIMKERNKTVDMNATMIVSMGIGMIITEVLSHECNQGYPIAFSSEFFESNGQAIISSGFLNISRGQVISLITGIVLVSFLFWFLYKTKMGRSYRAIAENPKGAKMIGIPVFKSSLQSFALSGFIGGIAAVLMILLLGSASSGLGNSLSHKVLAVSIIAGLGNLTGGLFVSLLLGIFEALIQGYFAGSWSNAIAFFVMLIVILIKPKGIFGSRL